MKSTIQKCRICERSPSSGLFGISRYWYCKNCELAWIKKIPKVEYGDTYYKGKSSILSRIFSPIEEIFYKLRGTYSGTGDKRVWIDIGAGDGGYLRTVSAKKKIGVELSASGRYIMEKSGLQTLSDKEFLKTKGLNTDIVSFWHVLEHVENPWEYLESARQNLKREGKIVIGVPNIDSFEFKFAKEFWFHLQPQFHLWHFSTNSLIKLLDRSGFSIEKIDHWAIEHHLTGILQSFINKTARSKENVLHRVIKRQAGSSGMKLGDFFWTFFWMTIGSPIILLFWIAGSIFRKAGTIVVIASLKRI